MRFWNFRERPYRPVECKTSRVDGQTVTPIIVHDVFIDANGRLWYAGTAALRALLPEVPTDYLKIPPEFWEPTATQHYSDEVHREKKREAEDARADQRFALTP